jgi:hypothetical protein
MISTLQRDKVIEEKFPEGNLLMTEFGEDSQRKG